MGMDITEKWKEHWKEDDLKNEKQKELLKQYASAAIPVPEEEWSKYPNTQPK